MAEAATVGTLLAELRRAFSDKGIDTAGLDARLLVGGILDLDSTALLTGTDRAVSQEQAEAVRSAMNQRLAGRPVHRILGARKFHGLDLRLSPETLEPRPDTETLVEASLTAVAAIAAAKGECRVLDLGIGTGAVGLAIIADCGQATCLGIDIAPGAVTTAAENAARLGLSGRYEAKIGDWFEGISDQFDVIVSNPPYIRSEDIAGLADEVRLHDPLAALDGGADGLDAYRMIAAGAQAKLLAGGAVFVEIGIGQTDDVSALFTASGLVRTGVFKDFAGIERVIGFARMQCSET